MEIEQIAKELSDYNMLKITINAHLNVYKEMLSEYETQLKEYLKQDIPPSLLDVQNTLISKTKASGCNKYIIHARNAILNGLSPKKNRKIPLLRYADVTTVKNSFPELEFYLNGGVEDISEIKKNTRRFAKRQVTWFKRDTEIKWFDFESDANHSINYIKSRITN